MNKMLPIILFGSLLSFVSCAPAPRTSDGAPIDKRTIQDGQAATLPSTIRSVSPGLSETNVALTLDEIQIEFEADIDSKALPGNAVELTQEGEILPGTLSVSGPLVTFTLSEPLVFFKTYDVSLRGFKDTEGNEIPDYSWTFQSRDLEWSTIRKRIDGTAAQDEVTSPSICMAQNGSGFVIWRQLDGVERNYYVRRHDPITGWDAPQKLSADIPNAGDEYSDQIHCDADAQGGVLFAWRQYEVGVSGDLYAQYRSPAGNWTLFGPLDNDSASIVEPQVAVFPSGKGMVIWTQHNGTTNVLHALAFDGTSFADTSSIQTVDTGAMLYHRIEPDGSGNAMAIWRKDIVHLNAKRYDAANGWDTTAVQIDDGVNGNQVHEVHLATDLSGNSIATWFQGDGTTNLVFANRFDADDQAWSGATNVNDGLGGYSKLAMNQAGDAVIAWQGLNEATRQLDLKVVSFDSQTAQFTSPVVVVPSGGSDFRVGIDGRKNVILSFDVSRSPPFVDECHTLRYIEGAGWVSSSQKIENEDESCSRAMLGVSETGHALLAHGKFPSEINAWLFD